MVCVLYCVYTEWDYGRVGLGYGEWEVGFYAGWGGRLGWEEGVVGEYGVNGWNRWEWVGIGGRTALTVGDEWDHYSECHALRGFNGVVGVGLVMALRIDGLGVWSWCWQSWRMID